MPGRSRSGTLSVGGKSVLVIQAGAPAAGPAGVCATLRLQREGDQTPATGLSGGTSVAIFADGQCGWSAQSDVPWITLTAGGGGAGNGTISYLAQPNPNPDARTGIIGVGEKAFRVNQLGSGTGGAAAGGADGGGDSGGSSGGDSGGDSG